MLEAVLAQVGKRFLQVGSVNHGAVSEGIQQVIVGF